MKFDTSTYRTTKEQIVTRIKDLHPKWETTEGFIADGVINPNVYAEQNLRILCILAESYGYNDSGSFDIEAQATEDLMGVAKVPTVKRLGILLWLLHESLAQGEKVTWEKWDEAKLPDLSGREPNVVVLQRILSKIAWINVKKASNANTRAVEDEVYAAAVKNARVLRDQIESAMPHLIIVCGKPAFKALVDAKVFGQEIELAKKWELQKSLDGRNVVEVSHPSTREWAGYEGLYGIFERVYTQLGLQ